MLLAILATTSCGDDQATTNEVTADQDNPAEFRPGNDITAIDAVSGEAANMAEDMNILAEGNAAANDTAQNGN